MFDQPQPPEELSFLHQGEPVSPYREKINRIERTNLDWIYKYWRLNDTDPGEVSPFGKKIFDALPIQICRFGGENDPYINNLVISMFEGIRNDRLEEGAKISKGPLIMHKSFDEGVAYKEYLPIEKAKSFCGSVKMNVPDILLLEGYGSDIHSINEFFHDTLEGYGDNIHSINEFFHDMIVWYGVDSPDCFILTEEGYKYISGLKVDCEEEKVLVRTLEGQFRNGAQILGNYTVSKCLGIYKT